MRLHRLIGAAIALFAASGAAAENWITVFDENPIWASVDKDSIRRGSDGLVYFQSDGPDKADEAADCQKRKTYTLKLYVMNGLDYPNWRDNGHKVLHRSVREAELQYVCANAG